ncbi:hypothetical protein CEP54_010894 [Fusarium duplospermum]|uniref:Branched-chain-amino-acid aminotransferase n=1 Tax=Fusarium duplospermum TaxID=1325734 RepID=A0A428PHF1_9HYPO|nr:hypothetical protein CEP54_010894 [Fusarium duplospermum]
MASSFSKTDKLRLAFRFCRAPFQILAYVIRGVAIASARNLPLRIYAVCAVAKALQDIFDARDTQYLCPTTRQVYESWIQQKLSESNKEEHSEVVGRLRCDIEPLRDGHSSLLWVGDRSRAKKVVLFFHGGGYIAPLLNGYMEWVWRANIEAGIEADTEVACVEFVDKVQKANPGMELQFDLQEKMAHDFIVLEGEEKRNGESQQIFQDLVEELETRPEWDEATGWESPVIKPFGPLSLIPSANVLQYATGCFEGIKAYRGYDGQLRLFRLKLNCERMVKSSVRVGLPSFDPAALDKLIHSFVTLEAERWLPKDRSSLYILATLTSGFSTNGGITLLKSPVDTLRAWPGGFGNAKLSANYGPILATHADAISQGFDQVLWLFGNQQYATEAGASNFFVVWRTKKGDLELVIAGLENKTILEGITRRSVIELLNARRGDAQSWIVDGTTLEPLTVVERDFSIEEIREAVAEGRLVEAFASGTACFIASVKHIRHREDVAIPREKSDSRHYAAPIKGWLSEIVYGRSTFSDWTKVVKETS